MNFVLAAAVTNIQPCEIHRCCLAVRRQVKELESHLTSPSESLSPGRWRPVDLDKSERSLRRTASARRVSYRTAKTRVCIARTRVYRDPRRISLNQCHARPGRRWLLPSSQDF